MNDPYAGPPATPPAATPALPPSEPPPAASTRARPPPERGGFRGEPNPLLVRELRQSLRLARLPWTITAAVAVVGLGMLAVGSAESPKGRSAQLGVALFQGLVSILLMYVTMVGPATAAGAIALEREGKTLEPLLLTSMTPSDIARGKFLAAYATLGLQIVALLPLAAIPLLFGGVSPGELVISFVFVAVVAAVAVAFGLAVASRTQSLRSALAVSILLPAASTPLGFLVMTLLGETLARKRWPFLTGGPIWWATAYSSVPFGADYVVWLVLWPLVLLGIPLWLFGALSSTNLSGPNDDRSSAIRRWYVVALASLGALVAVTCFRVELDEAVVVAVAGEVFGALLLLVSIVLMMGEPLAPSRLVRARWSRTEASGVARALGPGLMRAAAVQIVIAAFFLAMCFAGGVLASSPTAARRLLGIASGAVARPAAGSALAIVTLYALMFDVFLVGLGAYLRTRRGTGAATLARAWTLAAVFVAATIPWVVAAMVRSFVRDDRTAILFAAPSPIFALYAFQHELLASSNSYTLTVAALATGLAWGAMGLVLLGVAWERVRRAIATARRAEHAIDRRLDEEDDDVLAPGGSPPPWSPPRSPPSG